MPDGTKVEQGNTGQRIIDNNGNSIRIWSEENPDDVYITHYEDELTGREIKYTYDSTTWDGQVQYRPVGGSGWVTTDIDFDLSLVQGKTFEDGSPCNLEAWFAAGFGVIRSITLPRTQPSPVARPKFQFEYNSDTTDSVNFTYKIQCEPSTSLPNTTSSHGWGGLSRMETPTGAAVNYAYALDGTGFNQLGSATWLVPSEQVNSKTVEHDGITETWTYGSGVVNPDGTFVHEYSYPHDLYRQLVEGGWDGRGGLVYKVNHSNKTLIERHWSRKIFTGGNDAAPGGFAVFNPIVDAEYTSILDDTPQHAVVKMSAKTYDYDYNGNLLTTTEYDWFDATAYGNLQRDAQGVPTGIPAGAQVIRVTNHEYYNPATLANSGNVYAQRSGNGAPRILNALKQTTLGNYALQLSYDYQSYGTAPTNGNVTTKSVWNNVDSAWITQTNTYDTYGNLLTATDGRGKVTQYAYGDPTHALPTSVTTDPQNGTGSQTTYTGYDYSTGLITSQTDANGQVSTIDYTNLLLSAMDPLGRPGIAKSPSIGGQQRRVTTTYVDNSRQIIVETDLNTENDKLIKSRTTVDQLGRPTLIEQSEDGSTYTLQSNTLYLDMGRVTLQSNLRRSSASSTDSWRRTTKDSAGRVIEVASFGGATQPAWSGSGGTFTGSITTSYEDEYTTVTDQVGKLRRSRINAIGQVVRIDEPNASNQLGTPSSPNQSTSYQYDVFGNLTTVTQGTQTRTFTYDALSRLRSTVNPESGTTTYKYDDASNLIVRTDARSVSTHYEYDGINRLIRRWYNTDSSVGATTHTSTTTDQSYFYYDSQSLPSGAPSYSRGSAVSRLVAQTYGGSTSSTGDYFAYDVLGRVTSKYQRTGSVNYQTQATYSLSGAVTGLTYPSGRTVTNSYDTVGRLTGVAGTLGDGTSRTYSTAITYMPTGALAKEQFGTNTPVYNKSFYNSRGQLSEIRVSSTSGTDTSWNRGAIINHFSDQCWGMCSGNSFTDDNGNLQKQEIYIPDDDAVTGYHMKWQQYGYDSLNRLVSAREILNGGSEQWKQQFTYDRYGNRTIDQSITYGTGINKKEFTVDTSTNRLGVPGGQSGTMTYDAAGNLTNDTYTGAGTRTYDGENKIVSAWGGNNQAQLYGYDVNGNRIKRTVDGVETWQVYGIGNELLAEYAASGAANSPQKEYGYRSGQVLITAAPTSGVPSAENVNWTNATNVNVSGNSLSKNGGTTDWDAGAVSTQSLGSGDGYLEFTVGDATTDRMIGLSVSGTVPSYTALNYAFRPYSNGTVYISESGTNRGMFAYYSNGDKFRIAIESGVVKYYQYVSGSWSLLYTSSVTPTFPMKADAVFYNMSGTLNNVLLSGNLGATRVNVAASINGGTATASSTYAGGYQASNANNGNRVSGEWNDNTGSTFPDWLEVAFAASRTIDEVDVFMVQDNYSSPSTPTDAMTFVNYGLTSFDVQYWNGSSWATVSGGSITGNNKVWKKIAFSPITTTKIRVVANASPDGWSRLVEVEAWTPAVGGVQWLVTDHLGTPRIILDQSGSLENVKRHDYLPFGEELFAGITGRSAGQGYSGGDAVRQQFSAKERDLEIGLDYSVSRYYSPVQGRFTSPDPLLASGKLVLPQSWNRYTYCLNRPLTLIDPLGLIWGYYEDPIGQGHFHWYEDLNEMTKAGATPVTTFVYKAASGYYITLNPNAKQWAISVTEWDAHRAYWGYTGLAASWQDYVPVWGQFRKFMFNYATGNYEGALINFGMASGEGGTLAANFVGGAAKQVVTEAAEEGALKFSQTTASATFSEEGNFAGKTIGQLAEEVRSGAVAVNEVKVGVVEGANGTKLIVNTRSALALKRAGVPERAWNIVDYTAVPRVRANIADRLFRNGLTNEGTDVLRITGLGKNASSLK